jgi:ubiquinone/menaquinone biosynthesis C-methylase UbiE
MSFDVSGSAYDRFMGRYAQELAAPFADFAGVREGHVVDVGCGTGVLTEELARRVGEKNVAAVDPSPMVDACRARVPEADVRTGAAEALPWPDGTFDAALAQLVLHFLEDPRAGLVEMGRVVRPGGVVAGSSWNFPQMPLLRTFWQAARELIPTATSASCSNEPVSTALLATLEMLSKMWPLPALPISATSSRT